MKRKLLIRIVLTLTAVLAPLTGFAGNDVNIDNSVFLSVNGANISVTSGAKINKLVVSGTSFTTTMSGTSTMKISSSARRALTVSPSNMGTGATCTSNESSVSIGASSTGDPVVVTVDVSSNTCSSGGGGSVVGVTTGGGGSSPTPPPVPPPTPTPISPAASVTPTDAAKIVAAATAALKSPPPGAPPASLGASMTSVSASFTKNLGPGVMSLDVKRLQQLLNSDEDTMIADTGVGSPGHESDYYGALTVKAVQKFQAKYGLVSEGTPSTTGYGALGPKTRAAIEMYLGGNAAAAMPEDMPTPVATTPSPTPAPTPMGVQIVVLTNALAKGKTHSDVKALQQVLNSDPDTMISDSGTGSPGNETNYFGAMTEKAVQKFQEKYGLAAPGDPGYGAVGPKTRAKINELFGQQEGSAMMTTPRPSSPTPTPASASGSADDIQAQINAALKRVADLQTQIGAQGAVTPPPAPPPAPAPATSDTTAIEKQIQDALKKIQEISAQIKAQS